MKRARSSSRDKERKSRSRCRGEKSKHSRKSTSRRAPTPKRGNKGRYQSVARQVSGTKTDSEPDEAHRQVRERSSSRDSTPPRQRAKSGTRRKEQSRRIRCKARQLVQTPHEWQGMSRNIIAKLRRAERNCEHNSQKSCQTTQMFLYKRPEDGGSNYRMYCA